MREHLKKSSLYHAPLVTYGYAITGHKAQGGEWNEVWIDYHYTQNRRTEGYFRWMYTAVTRAKNMVFAISPPEFDDIAEALARGIERCHMSLPSRQPTPSLGALPLHSILARHGYVATEIFRKQQYLVRVMMAKSGDPFADAGCLDLNFNGKDVVSHVRLSCTGASDDFGNDVSSLKGRSIRSLLPTDPHAEPPAHPEVDIVESHARIRDRLVDAAGKAGLRVLSVKSFTSNQLRLGISSEMGDGHVDFYIDGKGRVTEIGSMTIPLPGLERLKAGLAG